MIRICVAGATGRMGKAIIEEAQKDSDLAVVSGFSREAHDLGFPVYAGEDGVKKACSNVDVWVDFTTPDAFLFNLPLVLKENVDIVVGTTGWYDKIKEVKRAVEKSGRSMVLSPNFSALVNVQFYMAKILTVSLSPLGYAFGVVEEHQEGKIDVPSGTADRIADIIMQNSAYKEKKMRNRGIEKKTKEQLDMASLRLRGTVGDHEIRVRGDFGRLDVTSMIYDRKEFANGALQSIKWLHKNRIPGSIFEYYKNVLGFK